MLQIESAWNSLRKLKYKWDPILPFFYSLISFESEGKGLVVNEHKALKFPRHDLLGFTQVSPHALERSSDAIGASNFLTALIFHAIQEAGLVISIHVLNE